MDANLALGPFTVYGDPADFPGIEAKGYSVVVYGEPDMVDRGIQGPTPEVRWATARLFAAAPDLLRSCQEAAQTFRHYEQLHKAKGTPDGDEKAYANHVIAHAIEADIAKATGQ